MMRLMLGCRNGFNFKWVGKQASLLLIASLFSVGALSEMAAPVMAGGPTVSCGSSVGPDGEGTNCTISYNGGSIATPGYANSTPSCTTVYWYTPLDYSGGYYSTPYPSNSADAGSTYTFQSNGHLSPPYNLLAGLNWYYVWQETFQRSGRFSNCVMTSYGLTGALEGLTYVTPSCYRNCVPSGGFNDSTYITEASGWRITPIVVNYPQNKIVAWAPVTYNSTYDLTPGSGTHTSTGTLDIGNGHTLVFTITATIKAAGISWNFGDCGFPNNDGGCTSGGPVGAGNVTHTYHYDTAYNNGNQITVSATGWVNVLVQYSYAYADIHVTKTLLNGNYPTNTVYWSTYIQQTEGN